MIVEIDFIYLNMGLSLCLLSNLGASHGRFRWVFDSLLFAVEKPHREQHRTKKSTFITLF